MRPQRAFRKTLNLINAPAHQRWTVAIPKCQSDFRGRTKAVRGAELSGRFDRLLPVIIVFAMWAGTASAETAAETARKWGLIGRWALDCALPPDRDRGAVLAYEVETGCSAPTAGRRRRTTNADREPRS